MTPLTNHLFGSRNGTPARVSVDTRQTPESRAREYASVHARALSTRGAPRRAMTRSDPYICIVYCFHVFRIVACLVYNVCMSMFVAPLAKGYHSGKVIEFSRRIEEFSRLQPTPHLRVILIARMSRGTARNPVCSTVTPLVWHCLLHMVGLLFCLTTTDPVLLPWHLGHH